MRLANLLPTVKLRLKTSVTRLLLAPLVVLLALSVGACVTAGTTTGSRVTSVACGSFKPIYWSHEDTDVTIEQVVGHNAAGKRLCHWKATTKARR